MGARMSDGDSKEMIKEIDIDKDGQVNLKEFVVFILDHFFLIVVDEDDYLEDSFWTKVNHVPKHDLWFNILCT